jgi:adenine-specific DNA-methyltransferase
MARIDDLVSQIADKGLKEQLESALADIRRRQRFGLVFEEHIPETASLPNFPIQVGTLVQEKRDLEGKRLYTVRGIEKAGAVIEPEGGGEKRTVPLVSVTAVKRFGDAIFPSLTSVGVVRRGPPEKPHHAVVNGENFHALQLFAYLYERQVDCIYIDPPYNTGARDWKYNNRYVDEKDQWRHSKWLSFMEKRLRLARRLLKSDGVLIVTIDEHEVHHLGMLLEKHFLEYARHMVTVVINPKGTGADNFARVEEYAFFVVPKDREYVAQMPFGFGMPVPPKKDSRRVQIPQQLELSDVESEGDEGERTQHFRKLALRRDGAESSHRSDRWRQFYAIHIDESKGGQVVGIGPEIGINDDFPTTKLKGLVRVYPIDQRGEHRVWRYGRSTMESLIKKGEIRVGRLNPKTKTYSLYHLKPIAAEEAERRKPRTVWWHPSHDAGAHGSSLLNEMLGERAAFPFPKSLYAVRDCLKLVVGDRPDALIVDFFAGSGTTLHATSLLNAEDNGQRRTVLVTNNEVDDVTARQLNKAGVYRGDKDFEARGIFEAVTRPRCEAAITGKRPDGKAIPADKTYAHLDGRPVSAGLDENVEFFRLDYLDADDVDLGNQFRAIFPSLWLASGAVGQRPNLRRDDEMVIPEDAPYAVLLNEDSFRKFRSILKKRPDIKHVWLVTDSEDAFAEMRASLPNTIRSSMLYRDYLRNFKINTIQSL